MGFLIVREEKNEFVMLQSAPKSRRDMHSQQYCEEKTKQRNEGFTNNKVPECLKTLTAKQTTKQNTTSLHSLPKRYIITHNEITLK